MQRLSLKTHAIENELPIKIVHFGIGAFARCHLLDYIDRLGAQGWGVLGVSLRSPDQKSLLEPQNYLYSTLEQSENGVKVKVISALKGVLVASLEHDKVLAALAAKETAIVSLTITEKGYLDEGEKPAKAIQYLVEGLQMRFELGLKPFTVLCCDNLSQNGKQVRVLVLKYAQKRSQTLANWIAKECAFPSSMVDRIVPAQTLAVKQKAAELLGLQDEAALAHEAFTQWVIEDNFGVIEGNFVANNRPPFEKVGVQLVQDVMPYEAMKLKMLNGAHSAIAYLGQVEGLDTVDKVMSLHKAYIWDLWREIIPCVEGFTAHDLEIYANSLEKRFLNPHLQHKTAQIAMDGSQKLPPRLLKTIVARRAKGLPTPALNKAIALWMHYVTHFEISDPQAETIKAVNNKMELLNIATIFPTELRNDSIWIDEVKTIYQKQ